VATDRFNRQFILLDFADLDNPEFMAFVRSPEFSTYLVMRRHIWRSTAPHSMGLHEYYAQGQLACSLDRDKIAEAVGGLSRTSVSKDITSLENRGVIQSIRTGRQSIYILGKWGRDPDDQVYYEYFFLDRLSNPPEDDEPPEPVDMSSASLDVRCQENLTSDVNPDATSSFHDIRCQEKLPSDVNFSSHINRESNRESNREGEISNSKPPAPVDDSTSSPDEEEGEVLESQELEVLVETCSREFADMGHLESNLTRAFNLWARTQLDEQGMLGKAREARDITKQRISLSAIRDRTKRMAYFFSVLEDLLGLREPVAVQRSAPG